jgi:hypothetical protein
VQAKHRKTGFMSWTIFKAAIKWVKFFCMAGTQRELNLFGVGEPCLHHSLVDMVEYARRKLPFKQILHLNTNGNTMTRELAIKLRDAGISEIDITAHEARSAANTVKIFREVGIIGNLSIDFIVAPNNWAGQVKWFEPDKSLPQYSDSVCPWLARGQVMVMSDGKVTTCCIDAFATNTFADVMTDDLSQLDAKPFKLCKSCHHVTPGLIQNAKSQLVLSA